MNGRLEWSDPTPDGPTPEEEAVMDAECPRCNGGGQVQVFSCNGVCECGHCPDLDDCPECRGTGERVLVDPPYEGSHQSRIDALIVKNCDPDTIPF